MIYKVKFIYKVYLKFTWPPTKLFYGGEFRLDVCGIYLFAINKLNEMQGGVSYQWPFWVHGNESLAPGYHFSKSEPMLDDPEFVSKLYW